MIYRITNIHDLQQAQDAGYFSSRDLNEEGFIHCSSIVQVIDVANRLYRGRENLVILEIEETKLSAPLKWEDTHNSGELYPHVYGTINLNAILRCIDFPADSHGNFGLPLALRTNSDS